MKEKEMKRINQKMKVPVPSFEFASWKGEDARGFGFENIQIAFVFTAFRRFKHCCHLLE